MQKLGFNQQLQQKLSPQQIQFIKLLQVPTAELESRIEEELEINPALEEAEPDQSDESPEEAGLETDQEDNQDDQSNDEPDLSDYLKDDDYGSYKTQSDNGDDEEDDREIPYATGSTLQENLLTQLGFIGLDERQTTIAQQLIGSIEGDGYIRRELESIVNDLAFAQGVDTTIDEVEKLLLRIQSFDPAGIAARNLQECLLLQLNRMDDGNDVDVIVAKKIIETCYEEFTKKHYDKIQKKLDLDDEEYIRDAIELIVRLNPKPGGESGMAGAGEGYPLDDASSLDPGVGHRKGNRLRRRAAANLIGVPQPAAEEDSAPERPDRHLRARTREPIPRPAHSQRSAVRLAIQHLPLSRSAARSNRQPWRPLARSGAAARHKQLPLLRENHRRPSHLLGNPGGAQSRR